MGRCVKYFKFPVTKMSFVAVDFKDMSDRYSISFPVGELPEEVVGFVPNKAALASRSPSGLFRVTSQEAPALFCGDAQGGAISRLKTYCRDTQIPLGEVLTGEPCQVLVSVWEIPTRLLAGLHEWGTDYYGMALVALQINAVAVRRLSWQEYVEGKMR